MKKHFALTGDEMRQVEQAAFGQEVPSVLVMENAARNLAKRLESMMTAQNAESVLFLCGSGNNGGDGLAAARIAFLQGKAVSVYLTGEPKTEQAQENYRYVKYLNIPILWELPHAENYDVLVDALFGIGLTRAPGGKYAEAIRWINEAKKPVLSVDVPSGMDASEGKVYDPCVKATETCTFHAVKQGMLLSPRRELCGEIHTEPIGIREIETGIPYYVEEDLNELLLPRPCTAHKGSCGRVLIFAGSMGKAGAAAMCALAALKAGAGLVTIACDEELFPIFQTQLPNAMCVTPQEALDMNWDVLAAGCGIGLTNQARKNLLSLLEKTKTAVLDADALNLLAKENYALPQRTVLTPHLLEGARLLGTTLEDMLDHPVEKAREIARKFNCTAVLKSSVSVIAQQDKTALNVVGSAALAKGGSGDALCGILAATLCEQPDLFEGSRLACLRMGAAGKKAGEILGERQVLTGEMLQYLK